MPADLKKIIQGKSLTEMETKILEYMIGHMDTLLEKGVRQIAKENYTSPASIMRLSKKLGYSGFIDMYYQLLPLINATDRKALTSEWLTQNDSITVIWEYNSPVDAETFVALLKDLQSKYIFIYATGFSGIIGEYIYKKLLVNGLKVIFATGTDSVGILESNIDSIGLLITITKSGETTQIIDKMSYCYKRDIPIVTFTNELKNTASSLAKVTFRIKDNEKLDDRNMMPNLFFAQSLILFEYLMKIFVESNKN